MSNISALWQPRNSSPLVLGSICRNGSSSLNSLTGIRCVKNSASELWLLVSAGWSAAIKKYYSSKFTGAIDTAVWMKINKSSQIMKFCIENSQKWLRSIAYFITVNIIDVRFITVNIDRTVKLF